MRIKSTAPGAAAVLAGSLLAGSLVATAAFGWTEPKPGSRDRAMLMDAVRPIAEWKLGAPVEFVVDTLRVQGDLAFAVLYPQRPGGGKIDIARTPMAFRDGYDTSYMDGARFDVLFQKSGGQWVAVVYEIGATDAWYAWDGTCAVWRPVLGPACP